jgi:hypothetical protein
MSTDNSTKESEDLPEFIYSNTPTSSTDIINIAVSKNGAVLMQLLSLIPEAIVENHRTVLSPAYVEEFIDELCDATNYYPKKPTKKTSKRAKSTTKSKK